MSLTARGAATLAETERGHRRLAASLFGHLPARQLDAFAEGLDHVLARLREEPGR